MANSRQYYPSQDESMSPTSVRSREWEGPSRWTEYLGPEMAASVSSTRSSKQIDGHVGGSTKALNIQWVVQMIEVADGLMAKMYRLNQILEYPDPVGHVFSEAFWKAGVFPNHPRICTLLSKKFPEHFSKLQLERIDKFSLDSLHDGAELHLQSLEPWIQLLLDLMAFREQALRLILDLSSTVITLLPHQNSLILHAFMDLFCAFVRVNLFAEKVLEAVGPSIFLSADTRKLRNEGFLSPYHPRFPDILTNSAHPMRAQDLANVTSYREWVLLGYLVCPDELLRVTSIDIALVVLKENLVVTLFRDEVSLYQMVCEKEFGIGISFASADSINLTMQYILLHEDYQLYVLPRVLESKKMAKSGRTKQKEADLEYSVAKQVEKMISEVHEQALQLCDTIHRERRILLKQEIGRMVLFFTDQPSLLAPNIQMVFSALALAQSEVLWYFQHAGIASSRSKAARVIPVDIDPNDPTIGFLLDGMDRLCCLVRKYISAARGYALSYLSSSAGRIRYLMGTPGIVALDLDPTLKGLFQRIVQHLESIPKAQGENVSAITCDLSDFRKDWLSILMIVTSSRSSINIRHLEKATVSTGKEGLLSEGNAAYNWSRNTMFGPEGRPQHCCAWLSVASSFPECASLIIPEEVTKFGRDAVLYVESLIESIMGGLEGLINILDSEGGFGALESQLLPEQAAAYLNNASRISAPSVKSPRVVGGFTLPGHESYPENNKSIKMLEAAIQRLTNLCSILNDMEPICVINHVFVLREYMRECILGNFKRRFLTALQTDNDLQRPSVLESLIRRHMGIVHLAEQHVSMDLTQGIREILLTEAFSGPVSSLHTFEKPAEQQQTTGSAVEVVCNWYMDNIIKDVSGAGILFAPRHKYFKSTRPVGGYFAESVTDLKELQAFVRIFGGYGVDRLDRMMKVHTAALVNCIETSLRSNRELIEAAAASMHSGDRVERDASVRQIVDLDTVIGFCIEAGQALAFDDLLAEASGAVLEDNASLIHSMISGIVEHIPEEIPEKKEIRRIKGVANGVGVAGDHDSEWVRLILEEVGGANDNSWSLLPYFFASFMTSNAWNTTGFNIETGGFSNNIHCLARCISAVIAGSEYVRLQREYQQQHQSLSNGHHSSENLDSEFPPRVTAEASIKSSMLLFVKFAASIVLDSWSEANRSHLVAKLIFLDQLCEISPYLPRSSLESHVPYTILRSIYTQYYSNTPSTPLSTASPYHSPSVSLIHASPSMKNSTTPQRGSGSGSSSTAAPDSGYFKGSSSSLYGQEHYTESETGNSRNNENNNNNKQRGSSRRSGPLDYSSSHKGGSGSNSTGPSPLPRFAVSRSGPISYKQHN
nr:unknown protein [Arabidopsis thaliana]